MSSKATLADDIIRGAVRIGEFIGETPKRTYYLAEKGLIPVGREGAGLVASKARLTKHYEQVTGAAVVVPMPSRRG